MENSELVHFLERIITSNLEKSLDSKKVNRVLNKKSKASDRFGKFEDKDPNVDTLKLHGRQIAEDLVKQAISSGLELTATQITNKTLKGGNTAEFVGELTLNAPFVFKMDSENKKLVDEGLAIQQIKNNLHLSKRFRDAWPFVYAIRSETPYAYLMEYFKPEEGWLSFEDRLYPNIKGKIISISQASRLINSILNVLFEGYTDSLNTRQYPSIKEDYVLRIKERLMEAAKADKRFESKQININGQVFRPWQEYIDILEEQSNYLAQITPPFITVVHGDPNPGNLLMKVTTSDVDLKLIDPKEWITGDYLFDICKITHFIEATGPVEKTVEGKEVKVQFINGDVKNTLSYAILTPDWTKTIVDICIDRLKDFALSHGDLFWQQRYELGMSSNLLGLPFGRLKKGNVDSASVLYGEGIKWLDKFCNNFKTNK